MKNKFIVSLLGLFALLYVTAGTSFAVTYSTSIRLQQPASQTNLDTFNITFVALDTSPDQSVTVQCQKKGPGDADFVNFGSLITLSNGGNTDNCQVNSGIVNQSGNTYYFRAIVNGSDLNKISNVVSVEFNNSKPGQPVNYNKTKPDNCTYKISFRTANDSGKTVKVVLYRSQDRSFSLDSGHQVNTLNIGSSTDGSMTDNISPNCNTDHFYAIRAFDAYGNGSDPVGDSNVTTTVVSPTGAPTQEGAIALAGGAAGGQVLGEETKAPEKEVLGTESAKPTPTKAPTKVSQNPVSTAVNWVSTHKTLSLLTIAVLAALAYLLYRRFFKKVK